MTKTIEGDNATVDAIKALQDEAGGATKGGVPRIGCKFIDGKHVPLNELTPDQVARIRAQCPSFDPNAWRGTREIHAVEVDAEGTRRLELTADTVEKIEKARAKKASDRTPEEAKLAAVVVKDNPAKPTEPTAEVTR